MILKSKEKVEPENNPVWNKLYEDERLSGEIRKELPEFLKIGIEHERKCIKLRLKQIEHYLDKITYLEAGMDWFDTLKHIQPTKGIIFPSEAYMKAKDRWEKKQKNKE